MAHTLTLSVPDAVYEPLVKAAEVTERKPEELAIEWLVSAARQKGVDNDPLLALAGTLGFPPTDVAAQRFADDPLEKWIGAIRTGVTDWADRHDYYIGQALWEEMRGKGDEGD